MGQQQNIPKLPKSVHFSNRMLATVSASDLLLQYI